MNELPRRVTEWIRTRLLVVVVTATTCVGIGFGVTLSFYLLNRPTGIPPRIVVVQAGASVHSIATQLKEERLIRSPRFFRVLSIIGSISTELTAGPHPLHGRMTTWDILQELRIPRDESISVTIPEGLRKSSTFEILARALDLDTDTFERLASDSRFCQDLGIDLADLEGYLFPETYRLSRFASEEQVLRILVTHFHKAYEGDVAEEGEGRGMTRHEVVTMASIIEEETRVAEERPIVSAVYHNRLRRRMRLQADPTVQFALPDGPRRLFNKDYAYPSPYNTYLHGGLPPGPIGSPGKAALEAAVAPADVNYLYFVAKGDGSHIFTRTPREHEAAKRLTRDSRRKTWRKPK